MAETAQEITIASDALECVTKDMSVALSDLLMDMQKHGAGEAQMNVKIRRASSAPRGQSPSRGR